MDDTVLGEFLKGVRDDAVDTVVGLDRAVHAAAPLDAALKWGKLTYAVDGDFHHWICAISVAKKPVTLTFHFGGLLPDPDRGFRQASSAFLRMLDYPTAESVDAVAIQRRIGEAIDALDYFKAHWKSISAGGTGPASAD